MMKSLATLAAMIAVTFTGQPLFGESDIPDVLSLPARQALMKWNFKFRSFSESDFTPQVNKLFKNDEKPYLVRGDFNGDSITDYALLGEAEKQQYAVALVSDKKLFKAVVLESWSEREFKRSSVPGGDGKLVGVPYYLHKVALNDYDKKSNDKKTDLIQVEAYLGSANIYRVTDNKAIQLNKR